MKRLHREISQNRILYLTLAITVLITVLALTGRCFAPNDPYEIHYDAALQGSSREFPLGTDPTGRCVLSRLLYGGFTSISMTILAVILKVVAGTLIGMTAGLSGGRVNGFLMRLTDLFMALPEMVCVIAIVGIMGPGLFNTMLAMMLIGWTEYARLSNSLVRSILNRDYIIQAKFAGVRSSAILLRYLLPNIFPQLCVCITLDLGSTLLTFAGLSLLGLGPQPPAAEWGYMLSNGKKYMQTFPQLMVYPGLCILVFVIFYNLLGDLLRDRFDPNRKTGKISAEK